jgi:hypothetical protein
LIPITIFDNFFKDPDKIVEVSTRLDYPNSSLAYPGIRTQNLFDLDAQFSNELVNKIFSMWTSDFNSFVKNVDGQIYFHKIKSLNNGDYTNVQNKGFIHTDSEAAISGIIYLNKNYENFGGTNFYSYKEEVSKEDWDLQDKLKHEHYSNTLNDISLYDAKRKEFRNKFSKSLSVKNRYNRLVVFDSSTPHAVDYFSKNNDEERLTIVFFLYKIETSNTLPRDRFNLF